MTPSHIEFTVADTFCSSITDSNNGFKHLTVSVRIMQDLRGRPAYATSKQWLISSGSGLSIVSDTFITSVLVVTLNKSRTGTRG